MSAPPDITVDSSPLWVAARSDADPERWAAGAARTAWERTSGPFRRRDVTLLATRLAVSAEIAFATGCSGVFFLLPEPACGPVAGVRLNGIRWARGTSLGEVVEDLLLPADRHLLPPRIEHLSGPGARRILLRQRAATEHTRAAADHLTWLVPYDEAGWLLSLSFPDPRQADRWLPDLDALAAAVRVSGEGAA